MDYTEGSRTLEAYKQAHLLEKKFFQSGAGALSCLRKIANQARQISESELAFWHFNPAIEQSVWEGVPAEQWTEGSHLAWKPIVEMAYQEESPILLHHPASWTGDESTEDTPMVHWPIIVEGMPVAVLILCRSRIAYEPSVLSVLDPLMRAAWQIIRECQGSSQVGAMQALLSEEDLDSWSSYLNQTDDAYFVVNPVGQVLDCSPGCESLFGLLKTQLVQKNLLKYVHEKDRGLLQMALERAERESALLNTRVLAAQGMSKMVQWKLEPHPNGHLWFLVGRDISEEYHNRQALEKTRSYAEQLIEALPDGVVMANPGGVHLDVNPAFEEMTGFSAEELKGTSPPYPYWPKEEWQAIKHSFNETLEGNFKEYELTFQRKNGERFPALVRTSQLLDNQGQAVTYYATVKDITQQKLVLEQVKENEYRFRQLVMNSPLAIIIHSDNVIRFCNPAAVQLLEGQQLTQFLGASLVDLLHQPESAGQERVTQLARKQGTHTTEERFVSAKGRALEVEVTSHEVQFEGKPAFQTIFRDITDRKQALVALQESEERYRFLVESVPHVIWTASEPGHIEMCNNSGLRFLRTHMVELLSQGWIPFVHPADQDEMLATWTRATQQLVGYRAQYRLGNPELENWRWMQEEAVPMKDDRGKIVRWYGIATDIHEKVLAENALSKREAFLTSLVQSQTTFLVRLNPRGVFQFVNQAFRSRFHAQAPILGKALSVLMREEDLTHWEEVVEYCLMNPGKPYTVQWQQPHGDQEMLWVAWEFVGIQSEGGSVLEIQGVGNEITQQKAAEARIEEERKKLINITNSVPGVVYQFRRLPNGEFSYEFVSKAAHQQFEIPPKQSFDFPELFSELTDEQREDVMSLLDESARTGKPWKYEFNFKLPSGRFVWLLNEAVPEPPLADGSIRWNGILTDITEQKSLKSLLDDTSRIAKVGGWELSLPAQTLNWTEETYRIHEVRQGQTVTLEKAIGFFTPRYQPIMEKAIHDVIDNGGSFDLTAQLTTAKGKTLWVRSQGRAIVESDRITRLMGTVQDVTISQEIELRLRENEAILRTSLEHSLVSNVLLGVDCNIVFVDERTRKQIQYFTGTVPVVGDWFPEFLPRDSVELFEELFAQAYKGETVVEERMINYPSQPPFWLEMVFRPVIQEPGEPASAVVVSYQDITKRKRTEQEVRKLAMVAENTDNVVVIINPQGYIEWANEAFVNLSGYQLEEVTGHQPGLFLFGPDSDKEVIRTMEEALAMRQKVKAELQQYTKLGESYWVELDMEPIWDQDGAVMHFILLESDITERKEAEKAIREQNEELKKTNEELDTFVYRVSHDLRAPLVSSLGLIELTMNEDNLDVVKNYMGLQQKSLKKLDNFIQDILNYSRNSRLELKPEPIDFQELVGGIFEQLDYIERYKSIERIIKVTYGGAFYSDQGRLLVVLSNLISNALKFSRHHREDAFVAVEVSGDAEWVEILIKDNGQGIPEEHLGNIFEMFYRATDRQSGSGLGLYIVKETIEKLGGTIEVSSETNQGTTFKIILPSLVKK